MTLERVSTGRQIARYHFARMWSSRGSEVTRSSLRANIRAQRHERAYEIQPGCQSVFVLVREGSPDIVASLPCPACLGEGSLDLRSWDAEIAETWTKEEIEFAVSRGMVMWAGIVMCETCLGNGLLPEAQGREMMASTVARIDQLLAAHDAKLAPPDLGS